MTAMTRRTRWLGIVLVIGLVVALPLSVAAAAATAEEETATAKDKDKDKKEEKIEKAEQKRAEIDEMAQDAVTRLTAENKGAAALYDKAFGYAVFDNLKIAVGISGGGGSGVAVTRDGVERTYMKMGTGGVGLGLGGQKYQVVFLFETEKAFRSFVDKGWKAETGAQAAAGTAGASAQASFNQGIAIYKLNDAGLMASVDVSGTKYWKNDKLNQ